MTILNHLFSPVQIGRMTAKNRLLMPAMSINFGVDDNGYVNDQLTGYFIARARGGAGMMLVGGGGVSPAGLELLAEANRKHLEARPADRAATRLPRASVTLELRRRPCHFIQY